MALQKLNMQSIRIGASADIQIRIETGEVRFAPISSISRSAPARVVTQAAHGLLDGWRVSVVDAKGMVAINDVRPTSVSVVDTTTIDLDGVSTLGMSAHTADSGALKWYAPKDLSGYTGARMDLKRAVGATAVLSLHTDDGTLEIDAATSSVWIRLSPTALSTAGVTARDYYFDIELIRPDGVDAICAATSVVTVLPEITTSI